LQLVQKEMLTHLSRHRSKTYTLPGLFAKIQAVYDQRENADATGAPGLTAEQRRLVERIHLDFTRAGAHFDQAAQDENADIQAQLASLSTQFMQNVLKDEETDELVLKREDLTGCPPSLVEAARNGAQERNKAEDDYVITLSLISRGAIPYLFGSS
jgi:peptidyl-dipeptidase Dcp